MITCNIMGGLGNQMFQICTTISYSIQHQIPFGFLYSEYVGNGITNRRQTYWHTLLFGIRKNVYISLPQMNIIQEIAFTYNKLKEPTNKNENICLYGYFQSYKYFDQYFSIISQLLNIKKHQENVIQLSGFTKFELNEIASIHFRIGDYKNLTDYHPILSYEYYRNSVLFLNSHVKSYYKILYFCEENDIDETMLIINDLKKEFPTIEFIKASNDLHDWQQMILMSCCKHNIIANSTFSWWGAYLNNCKKRIICYTSIWFGNKKKHHNTTDLFPSYWNQITSTKKKNETN